MVVLMGLGIGVTWAGGEVNRAWPAVLVALAFGLGLVVATLSPLAGWLSARRWLHRRLLRPLAKVLGTLEGFRVLRGALSAAVVRGCLFWCCAVTSQWCYMRAVGVDHVPLAYAGVVVTVTNLVTMLPIAMGGYGLREGTFSALLVAAGMATVAQGVAVGACLTAQTALFGLIGLPFVPDLAQSPRRVDDIPMACAWRRGHRKQWGEALDGRGGGLNAHLDGLPSPGVLAPGDADKRAQSLPCPGRAGP